MRNVILIVENETLVREAMEDILGADGMTIISASDGHEGIEAYRARRDEIELVLLDMRLPGMDGPDILRALRRINPSVKVIVSSGYDEQAVLQGFNGAEVTSILTKPFSAEKLITSVRAALTH